MITIGLVQELFYISKTLKTPISTIIFSDLTPQQLGVEIRDDTLTVFYNAQRIWKESLNPAYSMFGVESCSDIAKIVTLMNSRDAQWRNMIYIEGEHATY